MRNFEEKEESLKEVWDRINFRLSRWASCHKDFRPYGIRYGRMESYFSLSFWGFSALCRTQQLGFSITFVIENRLIELTWKKVNQGTELNLVREKINLLKVDHVPVQWKQHEPELLLYPQQYLSYLDACNTSKRKYNRNRKLTIEAQTAFTFSEQEQENVILNYEEMSKQNQY